VKRQLVCIRVSAGGRNGLRISWLADERGPKEGEEDKTRKSVLWTKKSCLQGLFESGCRGRGVEALHHGKALGGQRVTVGRSRCHVVKDLISKS